MDRGARGGYERQCGGVDAAGAGPGAAAPTRSATRRHRGQSSTCRTSSARRVLDSSTSPLPPLPSASAPVSWETLGQLPVSTTARAARVRSTSQAAPVSSSRAAAGACRGPRRVRGRRGGGGRRVRVPRAARVWSPRPPARRDGPARYGGRRSRQAAGGRPPQSRRWLRPRRTVAPGVLRRTPGGMRSLSDAPLLRQPAQAAPAGERVEPGPPVALVGAAAGMPLGDGEDVSEHVGRRVVIAQDRQAVGEQAVEIRLVPEGARRLLFLRRAPVRPVCAGARRGVCLVAAVHLATVGGAPGAPWKPSPVLALMGEQIGGGLTAALTTGPTTGPTTAPTTARRRP